MRYFVPVVLAAILCLVTSPRAFGQAFTYQGRLDQGGVPATGSFDFQFALFTAAVGGSQVGLTTQHNGVAPVDGLFTVNLSFANAFTGAARFLEVRVRPASTGGFTTLTARQPVTPAPYAIKSLTENFTPTLDGLSLFNTPPTTRVFLNRTTPVVSTEVLGVTALTGTGSGGVVVNHADTTGTPYVSFATGGVFRGSLNYDHASTSLRLHAGGFATPTLTAAANGRVGINLATAPTDTLEVAGTAAADSFRYRAVQTRTLSIPPEAFKPDLTTGTGQFGSSLAFLDSGQTGQITAPVYLPHDAVVTEITAVLIDNSAVRDMSVLLLGRTPINTTYFLVLGVSSTGANINARTFTTSGGTTTIDMGVPYIVRVTITGGAWVGASTAVKAVQITYTVGAAD